MTEELINRLSEKGVELSLKDGELRCRGLKKTLSPSIRRTISENKSNIISFLKRKHSQKPASEAHGINTRDNLSAPLSDAQMGFWVQHRFDEQELASSSVLTLPLVLELRGPLQAVLLKRAIQIEADRQWSLRTCFIEQGDKVIQKVDLDFIPEIVIREIDEKEIEETVNRNLEQTVDVSKLPLWSVKLFRVSPFKHILLTRMHHLIIDGYSWSLWFREISTIYQLLKSGKNPVLPPLPMQYIEYVKRQKEGKINGYDATDLTYWVEKLKNAPQLLELPMDQPRTRAWSQNGAVLSFVINNNVVKNLEQIGRSQNVTMFMVLMSAVSIILSRYSNQKDLLIGVPVADRDDANVKNLIGLMVNTIVHRTKIDPQERFSDLLKQVKQTTAESMAHKNVPFKAVVDAVCENRGTFYHPLVQVMVTYQQSMSNEFDLPGIEIERIPQDLTKVQNDLTFTFFDRSNEILVAIDYRTDIYSAKLIQQLATSLELVIEQINKNHNITLGDINILDFTERYKILKEWNRTNSAYPQDKCVHQLIAEQVERSPSVVAIVFKGEEITFLELNRKANQLANHLHSLGVIQNTLVGLCLDRSVEMVVSALAILKAGGAYVPLDPNNPIDRLEYIVNDCGAMPIVTNIRSAKSLFSGNRLTICLDDPKVLSAINGEEHTASNESFVSFAANQLAYVIFTSGSTGRPKGVCVSHRSLNNLLHSMSKDPGLREKEKLLAVTPQSFDISGLEFWLPLIVGAELHIAPEEMTGHPNQLANYLMQNSIDMMQATPTTWSLLSGVQSWHPKKTFKALCGGEILPESLARKLQKRCQLWNLYGPTETTIWSSIQRIVKEVNIGNGICNTQLYVTDEQLKLQPVGVVGHLYIGGEGLARGYLNNPSLTQEHFVQNPFSENPYDRLYKTGDLVRWSAEGKLEYIGRVDNQVKLRGFRIELGEIETQLLRHSDVAACAVVVREVKPEDKRLVAYVVFEPSSGLKSDQDYSAKLQRHIKHYVPDHMLPNSFVALEKLPLNPNGKVDRESLPVPEKEDKDKRDYAPANNKLERKLCELWQEALALERVGIHDNFFLLGGHSLLAVRIATKLQDSLHKTLPVKQFFETPTIVELAKYLSLNKNDAVVVLPSIVVENKSRYKPFPLTGVQQAYLLGRSADFELGNIATHSYIEIDLKDISLDRLSIAWNALIKRHDMLRAVFDCQEMTQKILDKVPNYIITTIDLRNASPEESHRRLLAIREEMSHQVLSPSQWPLFELRLTRISEQEHRLHYSKDALISDAVSERILFNELSIYCRNPQAILPPLNISFRDYIIAEESIKTCPFYLTARSYWLDRIEDFPMAPELPLAKRPGEISQPRFGTREFLLPLKKWERLQSMGKAVNVTPTVLIISLFTEVLGRWSKQSRFTLNLTLFNRLALHEQVDLLVGDFTSLTLLEVQADSAGLFTNNARTIQQQLWSDLEHRYFGGTEMLRAMNSRANSHQAIAMPVVFTSTLGIKRGESHLTTRKNNGEADFVISQTPQVWLDHVVGETSEGLVIRWMVLEDLFHPGLIDAMFDAYCELLSSISNQASLNQCYSSFLPTPAALQKKQSFESKEVLLHGLFQLNVRRQGKRLAIVSGDTRLNYEEVHALALALSQQIGDFDVQANNLVAVVMEKGWEQIVAVLGVLYAGAAYLPIDSSLPEKRIQLLLSQAKATLILTQPALRNTLTILSEGPVLNVDRSLLNQKSTRFAEGQCAATRFIAKQRPNDLAYVIFTSGSTGIPKGVMVDHQGAVNTILDINEKFKVGQKDTVLALSSLNFDLSVYDIFGTLAAGGMVVIPEAKREKDPEYWIELVEREGVTIWNSVPALANMYFESLEVIGKIESSASIRLVLLSGDWIGLNLPTLIKEVAPSAQIIGLGGATEASIWSIYYPIQKVNDSWKSIPYGKPLSNQCVSVLGEDLSVKPTWAVGELYIGGIGLAQGYWGDTKKTSKCFIVHPLTGERLYRTGDLGRYTEDGNIEFLGREDNQVKVQGHRIELGEIESILSDHHQIKESVVAVIGENQNTNLLGYIVPSTIKEAVDATSIQDYLLHRLPSYMIPNRLIILDKLPLTVNGKINKQALPKPDEKNVNHESYVAPRNDVEIHLCQLWQKTLQIEKIGIHDSFFSLGGNSLLGTRMVNAIRQSFDMDLPLSAFFKNTSISKLSQEILRHILDEKLKNKEVELVGSNIDLEDEAL